MPNRNNPVCNSNTRYERTSSRVYLYFLSLAIMTVWLAKRKACLWLSVVPFGRVDWTAGGQEAISCSRRVANSDLMPFPARAFHYRGVVKAGPEVAWREFRPSHGLFSVNMPADPIAQNPVVMNIQKYTMTKTCYESTIARQGGVVYCVADFSPPISVEKVSYEKMLEADWIIWLVQAGRLWLRSRARL